MSATRDTLGVPDTDEERAWELWCERGVLSPEFTAEIAERRRIQRCWDTGGADELTEEIGDGGSGDGEAISAAVGESDGEPERCMLFPADEDFLELDTQWIDASGDAFTDLAVVR